MFVLNGNRRRVSNLIFALIDGFFILAGVFAAIFIRFSGDPDSFFVDEYWVLRIMLLVFWVQMGFYYFDLYDPRLYGERKKMFILLLESFGASSILIMVMYYLIPTLQIGRGVFALSLILIFISSFFLRLVYARLFKSRAFRERVLIIGTGRLAREIEEEITNKGYEDFEIVGFIDEHGEETRERI